MLTRNSRYGFAKRDFFLREVSGIMQQAGQVDLFCVDVEKALMG